jgi:hypothetical protein
LVTTAVETVAQVTLRDPVTGRHKYLMRPVYVSPRLTRVTGITMGFLRFCRHAFMAFKVQHQPDELLLLYRIARTFDAVIDGMGVQRMPKPPPVEPPLIPVPPLPPPRPS